jgi:hypothetical protein
MSLEEFKRQNAELERNPIIDPNFGQQPNKEELTLSEKYDGMKRDDLLAEQSNIINLIINIRKHPNPSVDEGPLVDKLEEENIYIADRLANCKGVTGTGCTMSGGKKSRRGRNSRSRRKSRRNRRKSRR